MRLLVTGGAGYIGSIAARHLLERGDTVTVLDSLFRGHRRAVPEGAAFEQVDLLDVGATKRVLAQGFDAVPHFAAVALVAESVQRPELYYHGNVVASLNLLDAMRETGVRRLVFSSTCATYGQPERVPIAEDEPPAPVNAYGASKLAADRMLADEARAHGLGTVSLRYFNVAGSSGPLGEDHEPETHLIPLVLRAAAGRLPHVSILGTDYPTEDGTAVRDYVHVDDLARAHLLALDRTTPGRHEDLQARQRDRVLRARGDRGRAGGHGPRDPGQGEGAAPGRPAAPGRRDRDAVGWRPERSLTDMVRDAWAWHQTNPGGY